MVSKAQTPQMLFIYILAIVIFSAILLFGYSAVKNFREKEEKIGYVKFKSDLESIVRSIATDYGSVKIRNFYVPSRYLEVCFVDPDGNGDIDYPLIKESVDSGSKDNVSLMKNKVVLGASFYVKGIELDNKLLCASVVDGKIKIRFEGLGNATKISLP